MSPKQIVKILAGMPASDGAGVKLTRAIGQPALKNIDPFLMIDEIKSDDPNDYIAGFPPHPHRGFETLTYLMHGSMEHNDSTGGHGLIQSGGVQYMTAGRGIIHSETPKQDKGLLWGFQLWINLPAKDKMQAAHYVDIAADQIPQVNNEAGSKVKVIAGQYGKDATGPVQRDDINLHIYDVTSDGAMSEQFEFSASSRGYLYVYEGKIEVNGQAVSAKQVCEFGQGEQVHIQSSAKVGVLLAMAEPIGEPIVQYGPFVMNTADEINQALMDYQAGRLAS